MIINNLLKEKFEDNYLRMSTAHNYLHGYSGSSYAPFFIGIVMLPTLLFSGGPTLVVIIFWVVLLFHAYKGIKYLPIKDEMLKQIREDEELLLREYGLRYCGCHLDSHFINNEKKKYWNIKSEILFDNHSSDSYEKWHSQWSFDPKWLLQSYSKLVFLLLSCDVILSFYTLL